MNASVGRINTVPLRFWLGPFCLATAHLRVSRVVCDIDLKNVKPQSPEIAKLSPDLVGIFHQSEPSSSALGTVTYREGVIRYVVNRYEHGFIDLSGDFDGYLAQFSTKTRSTLKRKVRKFAAESGGEIDWRQYCAPHEMDEFHRHAREISRVTYQERLFKAGLPDGKKFVEKMHALAAQNRVRAYLLFCKNAPVSYLYCPVKDERLLYGHLGFVPEYAKLSPGTVLQLLVLERLFSAREFRAFDFTEGEGEHKRLFSTHSVPCADVFYLRQSLGTLALVTVHRVFSELARGCDTLLKRTGLRTWLRKMLRGTAV